MKTMPNIASSGPRRRVVDLRYSLAMNTAEAAWLLRTAFGGRGSRTWSRRAYAEWTRPAPV